MSDAIAGGARVAAGGAPIDGPGYFFEPTVLADVAEGVRIVDEEQFGPALPILRYHDGRRGDRARQRHRVRPVRIGVVEPTRTRATEIAEQLEVGTTFINTHAILPPYVQFCGAKPSGLGVENGVPGLLSFTEAQVVHTARG